MLDPQKSPTNPLNEPGESAVCCGTKAAWLFHLFCELTWVVYGSVGLLCRFRLRRKNFEKLSLGKTSRLLYVSQINKQFKDLIEKFNKNMSYWEQDALPEAAVSLRAMVTLVNRV